MVLFRVALGLEVERYRNGGGVGGGGGVVVFFFFKQKTAYEILA